MECRIFHARNRGTLQDKLNEWLEENPMSIQDMRFQFSTVSLEDETQFILEHTLVLFYVPLQAI